MAINFNGANPLYINYNGNDVSEVYYNGVKVWPDTPTPTHSVTISLFKLFCLNNPTSYVSYKVNVYDSNDNLVDVIQLDSNATLTSYDYDARYDEIFRKTYPTSYKFEEEWEYNNFKWQGGAGQHNIEISAGETFTSEPTYLNYNLELVKDQNYSLTGIKSSKVANNVNFVGIIGGYGSGMNSDKNNFTTFTHRSLIY